MALGPLSSPVADLCLDVSQQVDGYTRTQVHHVLRRLGEPAQLVATHAVDLPDDMRAELTRLVTAALEAAARWRTYADAGASPARSRLALVVHHAFSRLAQRIRGD
jgi:hypothetical protein